MITMSFMNLSLFDSNFTIVKCILRDKYEIKVMIDSGSDDYEFIDFVIAHEICETFECAPVELIKYRMAKEYDGRTDSFIIHVIYFRMKIGPHTENLAALMITFLVNHSVILGRPWMIKHEIIIDVAVKQYGERVVKWRKNHCDHLDASNRSFSIMSSVDFHNNTKEDSSSVTSTKILERNSDIRFWKKDLNKIKTFIVFVLRKGQTAKNQLYEAEKDLKRKRMISKSWRNDEDSLNIVTIAAVSFNVLVKQKDVEIFAIILKKINYEMKKRKKTVTNSKLIVSKKYHDFLNVFSKQKADKFSFHRKYDHSIELIEEKKAPIRVPLYRMSEQKLKLVKTYLEEHFNKKFIVVSSASFASSILFAKKSDGGLRFCVDFKKLNEIIKKNRYFIFLITDLMIRLFKVKFLTKIDIRHAFNRIKMTIELNENLITFRTRFESYKYLVFFFGLINEPATFQNFINDTLMNYFDKFVVAYLNDILIYSDNIKKHRGHVRKILQKFREVDIQANIDKCEFHKVETKFLDVLVERDEIRMNSIKIVAIIAWETPTNLVQIQSFFEFVNFYRRFIKGFSRVTKALTRMTKKNFEFEWTSACESVFQEFKRRVTEASILTHFNSELETIIESDSSDYVSVEILFQKEKDDVVRFVAFFSKTLLSAECNYEIYDKELLAIIRCFEKWRPELQSVSESIKVLTDHKSLKYFMITKKLNRRQVKWTEFFADFNFVVSYQAEKVHAKTNFLTKRSGDKSMSKKNDRQKYQLQTILTSDRLDARIKENLSELYFNEIVEISEDSDDSIDFHISTKKSELESMKNELSHKLFIFKDKRLSIIKKVHNQFAIDHSGTRRITQMLQRFFQWLKMRADVDQYIRNCHVCRRSKVFRDGQHDQLQSIFVEGKPWQDISLNFVTDLPKSKGHNAILMIVDRFSKMRHYVACRAEKEGISTEETAKLLIQNVWKLHELPKTIISDRSPQFVFLIWQALCKILSIKVKLSTAFHSETDDQSEICNQEMERYLRAYVNYQQDDWSDWLFMAEYVSNATNSATTKLSPFFVNYEF